MKNVMILIITLIGLLLISCGGLKSNLIDAADLAFKEWAQQTGTPFQNAEFQVLSDDRTFAQVLIRAELRRSISEPWIENDATIECRNVNNAWQCDTSMFFTTSERAIVATQEIIISATAIAQATISVAETSVATTQELVAQTSGRFAFSMGNHLYIVDADGLKKTKILETEGHIADITWSPTVEKIAFSTKESDGIFESIYTVDSTGANLVKISQPNELASSPQWSPNGLTILYNSIINFDGERDESDFYEMVIVNVDGSNWHRLTNREVSSYQPKWSPDGNTIVFISEGENQQPFLINADGSNERPLVPNLEQYIFFDGNFYARYVQWSQDNSSIAFELRSTNLQNSIVLITNIDTGETKSLSNNNERPKLLAWIPYQSSLWMYSYPIGDGDGELYAISLDGTRTLYPNQEIPQLKNTIHIRCNFSPDGSQVIGLLPDENGGARSDSLSIMNIENPELITSFYSLISHEGPDISNICWSPM